MVVPFEANTYAHPHPILTTLATLATLTTLITLTALNSGGAYDDSEMSAFELKVACWDSLLSHLIRAVRPLIPSDAHISNRPPLSSSPSLLPQFSLPPLLPSSSSLHALPYPTLTLRAMVAGA